MASTSNPQNTSSIIIEGQSTHRPPFFNGSNYTSWKIRMEFFLCSIDVELWEVIKEGFEVPKDANGLPLPKKDWSVGERRRYGLNCKAINHIFCVIKPTKFN